MNWKTAAGKAGRKEEVLRTESPIESDAVRHMVQGKVPDKYHGREVVVFKLVGNAFGTGNKEGKPRLVTLHNGILNQCSLEEPPTPYWAVLDAAIDLRRGFRKRDVMDLAVKRVGEAKRRACEMAWDVLRNHHRHARKRTSGMSHMIDSMEGGRLIVRARGTDETMAFFEAQGERAEEAKRVMAEMVQAEHPAEHPVAEPASGG